MGREKGKRCERGEEDGKGARRGNEEDRGERGRSENEREGQRNWKEGRRKRRGKGRRKRREERRKEKRRMAEEKHKRGRQKGKAINEEWLRADDKQNRNRGRRGEEKREKGIPPEIITKGRAFPARRVTPYTHTRVTSLPRTVRSFSFQEGMSTVRAESKRKEKKRKDRIRYSR